MSQVITQRSSHLEHSTHASSLQSTAMMRDMSNNNPPNQPTKSVGGVSGVAPPTGTPHLSKHDPLKRTVLGRVNVNIAHNGATAAAAPKHHHQPRTTRSDLAKSVPQRAPTHDVFEFDATKATTTSLGKRLRLDQQNARDQTLSKRARAEASQQAARHLEEQDKWIGKWRKAFPSLVFHFELGVEEGVGRGLRQRVLGMGAVSLSSGFLLTLCRKWTSSSLSVYRISSLKGSRPRRKRRRRHGGARARVTTPSLTLQGRLTS